MTASQTHGFLFADLRGYTQFAESRGDQAAADLLTRYRLLVRGVIARLDGAEIRTEGDSFYVVFPSASAAVNGGIAILEAAAEAGTDPQTGAIHVGIGVHAGETAQTPEGFVGSAVNVAARICALAGPGELLVSDTVRSLTRGFLGLRFVPRGRRRLKGIAEPITVFRVLPSTAAAGSDRTRALERWPPRLPDRLAAAVGLIGAMVAGIALAGALAGAGPLGWLRTSPPTESPDGASASPSGGPTSAEAGGRLTAEHESLIMKLPGGVGENCTPATAAEGSAGGSVSLHCELPLSAAADEVWVDLFPTPETLGGAFDDTVERAQAPAGDCATTPLAHGPWSVPNVHNGELLCYHEGGAAWLVWTYEDDRILMRARRGGGDSVALYAWWDDTAIFLR